MKIGNKSNTGVNKMTNGEIHILPSLYGDIRSNTFIEYFNNKTETKTLDKLCDNGGMCDDTNLKDVSKHGMCGSIKVDSDEYLIIYTSNYYQNVYASLYTIYSGGYDYKQSECLIETNGTTDMSGILGFVTSESSN